MQNQRPFAILQSSLWGEEHNNIYLERNNEKIERLARIVYACACACACACEYMRKSNKKQALRIFCLKLMVLVRH